MGWMSEEGQRFPSNLFVCNHSFFLPGGLPSPWNEFDDNTDSLPWKRDMGASKYISELLEAPQIEVECEGGSLTIIEMKNCLQRDERVDRPTLVIPSGTRGVWKALLEKTQKRSTTERFLVIGTPGVGKSRSLNYLIREIILTHRNKSIAGASSSSPPAIVFSHQNDKLAWLFVPKDPTNPLSAYEAYSVFWSKFEASGTAVLFDHRNYYIVDPSGPYELDFPGLVAAKTIFACGPNKRYFSEYAKHLTAGIHFLPCWKEQEIVAAIPYMVSQDGKRQILERSSLSSSVMANDEKQRIVDIVKARVAIVGPNPRLVLGSSGWVDEYKRAIERTMEVNQDEVAKVLRFGLFTLEQDEHIEKNLSAVFAIDVRLHPVSREPDYTQEVVRFVSDFARFRVGIRTIQEMWQKVFTSDSDPQRKVFADEIDRGAALRDEFMRLVWRLLQNGLTSPMEAVPAPVPRPRQRRKLKLREATSSRGGGGGGGGVEGSKDYDVLRPGKDFCQRAVERMRQMPLIPDPCASSSVNPASAAISTTTTAGAAAAAAPSSEVSSTSGSQALPSSFASPMFFGLEGSLLIHAADARNRGFRVLTIPIHQSKEEAKKRIDNETLQLETLLEGLQLQKEEEKKATGEKGKETKEEANEEEEQQEERWEEKLQIVDLIPAGYDPAYFASPPLQPNPKRVLLYRAAIPSPFRTPQLWTQFLRPRHKSFSTLRQLTRLLVR